VKHLQKYFVAGLIMLLASCDSSDEKPADSGLRYFPSTIGSFWIYDVNEIVYDTLIQNNVLAYQEKFEVMDEFENQLGERTAIVYIYKRTDDTKAWVYETTWSAKISTLNEIIVIEENVAFLKILLPVTSGSTWKGNKYNDIESKRTNGRIDNFVITDFEKPYNEFPETFKVEESDDTNFSYSDIRYSVYAEQVGLVYRINKYIDYCDENDCFGLGIRKHEVTKIQTLVTYEIK
jgi:hypothetical protein